MRSIGSVDEGILDVTSQRFGLTAFLLLWKHILIQQIFSFIKYVTGKVPEMLSYLKVIYD